MPKFLIFSGLILIGLFSNTDGVAPLSQVRKTHHQLDENLFSSFSLSNDQKSEVPILSEDYRLSGATVPIHYDLEIRPIIDPPGEGETDVQWTAPGHVKILFRCIYDSINITLHGKFFDAQGVIENSVQVRRKIVEGEEEPDEYEVIDVINDQDRDFYTFVLERPIANSENFEIEMDFVAPISQPVLRGLFRSSYEIEEGSGNRIDLAATQMQPMRARQMFPCYDEPGYKATFSVKIGRKENYNSMANGAFINSTLVDGWYWDLFEETHRMSAYLTAIVVSDYTCVAAEEGLYTKPVQVCGPPPLMSNGYGNYSANLSARLLSYFEELFDFEYPFAKMDSVSVEFGPSGMENFGLNIYQPRYLLYKEGRHLETERLLVTSVVTHEIAHQWFGNLITCEWWIYIWLNEGFANYLEGTMAERLIGEFKTSESMVRDNVQYIMRLDAEFNSLMLVIPNTNTQAEVTTVFSTYAYNKGSSIIRMMVGFLSEQTFFEGLKIFLRENAFEPVNQDHLFEVLNIQAENDGTLPPGLTVKEIMDTWTLQNGLPLIRVSENGANQIILSQEKFRVNTRSRLRRDLNPNEMWNVPISIASSTSPDFINHTPAMWMRKNETLAQFEINTDQWIIINPDQTGYYRVIYDAHFTKLILNQLETNPGMISPISRSQLLDDYFQAAYNDYVLIETALDLTTMMSVETNLLVWETFFANLEKIYHMISNTGTMALFRRHFLPMIETALEKSYSDEETDPINFIGDKVILKATLLNWACAFESDICLENSKILFENWRQLPEENLVPLNYQSMLYCGGMDSESFDNFEFLYSEIYFNERADINHRMRIMDGLICTKEYSLIHRLLEESLKDGVLYPGDEEYLYLRLAQNPFSRNEIFHFIRGNYERIIEKSGEPLLNNFVGTLRNYWNSKTELDQVNSFISEIEESGPAGFVAAMRNLSNSINQNIYWMENFYNPIKDWFSSNQN